MKKVLNVTGQLPPKNLLVMKMEILKRLKIVDLEWKITEDGRPAQFVESAGSEREIPCELALLAMGFVHPQHEGLIKRTGN